MKKTPKLSQNNQRLRSPNKINVPWGHPVTLLILSTTVASVGWLCKSFYFDKAGIQAGLRDTVQPKPPLAPARVGNIKASNTQQAISLSDSSLPSIEGNIYYCDTLKTTLVISYQGFGTKPATVTRVAIDIQPVAKIPPGFCAIDPLSSQPKGIALRDSYIFSLKDSGNVGKYIIAGGTGEAFDVDLSNILTSTNGTQTVSLKPNDETFVRDVYINSIASYPKKVSFKIFFDAEGERTAQTEYLYISSSR